MVAKQMDMNVEVAGDQFFVDFTMNKRQIEELFALMGSIDCSNPTGDWTFKLYAAISDVTGNISYTAGPVKVKKVGSSSGDYGSPIVKFERTD